MSTFLDGTRIVSVKVSPIDIPLREPFLTSRGGLTRAQNLFVELRLSSGVSGYGEIAPFSDITGEDRTRSHKTADDLTALLLDKSAANYRALCTQLQECAPDQPAARCGLETALLDALCRHVGLPMWAFFGGAHATPYETDVTIPLAGVHQTEKAARAWLAQGFRILKVKIDADVSLALRRVAALTVIDPQAALILDANQAFDERTALEFVRELERIESNVVLIEQPVVGHDLAAMAAVTRASRIPVAADESVTTPADAIAVVQRHAANVVNLKIMKSGVLGALSIATIARAGGLDLMIGGMVETRLAMSCSLAVAIGLGGLTFVDLDTPLLLEQDPLVGGYYYDGPLLQVSTEAGLGLEPRSRM